MKRCRILMLLFVVGGLTAGCPGQLSDSMKQQLKQQMVEGWQTKVATMPFSVTRFNQWIEEAAPDQTTRDAATRLFSAYQQAMRTAGDTQMQRIRDNVDYIVEMEFDDREGVTAARNKLIADWGVIIRNAERELVHDIADLLTEHELAAEIWWSHVRASRRDRLMYPLSGPIRSRWSMDLVALLDDLELDEADRVEIAQLRYDYERELDNAIVEVEDRFYGVARDAQIGTERLLQLTEVVAEIERRYFTEFHTRLPEAHARQFRLAVEKARYPFLFVRSPVESAILSIRTWNGLSDDERQALSQIAMQYQFQAEQLRTAVLAGADEYWSWPAVQARKKQYDRGVTHEEIEANHPASPFMMERRQLEMQTLGSINDAVPGWRAHRGFPPEARFLLELADGADPGLFP